MDSSSLQTFMNGVGINVFHGTLMTLILEIWVNREQTTCKLFALPEVHVYLATIYAPQIHLSANTTNCDHKWPDFHQGFEAGKECARQL